MNRKINHTLLLVIKGGTRVGLEKDELFKWKEREEEEGVRGDCWIDENEGSQNEEGADKRARRDVTV